MAHPEIEEWLTTSEGKALDPDGAYGNQCVDLPDAYGEALFGVHWSVCVGGVQGARELLDAAPDKYWTRIDNDPNNPNLIPQRGDIVVTSGDATNPWGHTYAVEAADTNGVDALQQDGFAEPLKFVNGGWYSDKPAHRARLPYEAAGMGYTKGWLRPKENMIVDTGAAGRGYGPITLAPAAADLLSYQRIAGSLGVNYRKAPDPKGEFISMMEPGKVYDFKGFARRTPVDGNDIWFVGRYSGGFAHSSGFTNASTDGLDDLTAQLFPAPAPAAANLRVTGADGVNRRKVPDKNGDLINTFGPDLEITLAGWVTGTDPYGQGNTVWFVGGISGGYMHSSGFTNPGTDGLAQLPTPDTVWTPATPAAPKPAYDFVPDFDWVQKVPAALSNLEKGRAPVKDGKTVIHQMGTPGRDTIGSTANEFSRDGAFKSSHFGVAEEVCQQYVSLADRAYHAGAGGNDWVGIETDPAQSAATIATTVKLLTGLKNKGYSTVLIRHKDVPGNNTSCGTLIDLDKYRIIEAAPAPVPSDPPTSPVGPSEDQVQVFLDWLKRSFDKRAS